MGLLDPPAQGGKVKGLKKAKQEHEEVGKMEVDGTEKDPENTSRGREPPPVEASTQEQSGGPLGGTVVAGEAPASTAHQVLN